MNELRTTELAGGELAVRSESERTIEARLLAWDDVADTPEGRERFARGAFRGTDPRRVTLEAIGPHGRDPGVRLVGRAQSIDERADGPYATFRVSRVAAGDELLELVRDGVYSRVSVVFEPVQSRSVGGIVERQRVNLRRVGIVERGAYSAAEVVAVRSEGETMPRETEPIPTPTPDPTPDPDPVPAPTGRAELIARTADNAAALDALRSEMLLRMTAIEARGPAGQASPLARYATFAEYADAAYSDPELAPLMGRALADQLTTDSPGVMAPTWLTEIVGIIAARQPAIRAMGGARGLGSTGMELDWPVLDPTTNLDAIVALQAAEKTEVNSVKVKILKGSAPISTWAGGSDISYQLIRRSSPSYRDAYLRILAIAYAREVEAAFEAALLAGATSTIVIGAAATADAVRAAAFAASATVEDYTGSPATVWLASPTEWLRLGGLAGLWPTTYGTSNVAGTAQASTLRINISGLEVIRAPFLTGQVNLFTNEAAAGFHQDGPFPISAEDVAKLGQNHAIWGMGATPIYIPKGIVKSTLTVELAADEAAGRRK